MLSHAAGEDVTLGHYVGKSETLLRAAWQTVADFNDAASASDAEPVLAAWADSKICAQGSVSRPGLAKALRAAPRTRAKPVTRKPK